MKRRYTKAEIQQAREVNLIELLTDMGYGLVKRGSHYFLQDHDSFCFFPENNDWHWFSQGIGGNTIDFFMKGPYHSLSFMESVELVLKESGNFREHITNSLEKTPKKMSKLPSTSTTPAQEAHLTPPPKAANNKRVIAYLVQKRKIDYGLVTYCLKSGKLYETAQYHNAAFVGYDRNGDVGHIFLRGTTDNRFAGDVDGSDKRFVFSVDFSKQRRGIVHVFESPIDLLSYLTIEKLRGNRADDTYLSLSGTSLYRLYEYMMDNDVQMIYVRTDNDEAGRKACESIRKHFPEQKVEYKPPVLKDYNDDLVEDMWRLEKL